MFTPDDHTQPTYEILLYITLIFIGLIALLFTLSVIAVITAVYAGPHD